MTAPALRVRLRAGYGKHTILEDVAFELAPGERFGLVGSSGAGKSTLVLALLGLLHWRRGWVEGEVLLGSQNDGINIITLPERDARKLRGKRIALVPQSPMSALNPAITLRAHFEQAWKAHRSALGQPFEARLAELIHQVHLPTDSAFLRRRPGAVSVGQAQRAVLALALLHRPSLLIADEPTSALDPATLADILALLREINREQGTAILYISHDLLSVVQFCTRLAVLDRGSLVECAPVAELGRGPRHPATQALLRTLPVPIETLLIHAGPFTSARSLATNADTPAGPVYNFR